MHDPRSDDELIRGADALHASASRSERELLAAIAEVDRRRAWRDSGARDTAHWVSMRYGISAWKAHRWLAASRALEALSLIADALNTGELGIDKVVELTRFATPDTQGRLLAWAKGVSCGAIRHRADLAVRQSAEDTQEGENTRSVSWWYYDEGRRFGMDVDLPAAYGPAVARKIDRLAARLSVMPEEEGPQDGAARRADALLALCSSAVPEDADPDVATVVVHAPLAALVGGEANAEIEDGPVIPPEAARRLACNARVQVVLEDDAGHPLRLGRTSREPSAAMLRQLRYRDRECQFPGCGSRRFTQAHHIVWWADGGRTDLDNLVLICTFHHRLVHEHGWRVTREPPGVVRWFRPGGVRYRAGPLAARAPAHRSAPTWIGSVDAVRSVHGVRR